MTDEDAALIRRLRIDEGLTWRSVAEEFSEARGNELPWAAEARDQFDGMTLCEEAARRLGEDPAAPPWN